MRPPIFSWNVRFSSPQDGIYTYSRRYLYVLGKAIARSNSPLKRFPSLAFKTVQMLGWWAMAPSRGLRKIVERFQHSTNIVSQVPQHFCCSETQATCDFCFTISRQSVCSVISLDSGMSRTEHPLGLRMGMCFFHFNRSSNLKIVFSYCFILCLFTETWC